MLTLDEGRAGDLGITKGFLSISHLIYAFYWWKLLISLFFLTDFLETPTKGVGLFFTVIALLKSKKSKIHQDLSLNYFE